MRTALLSTLERTDEGFPRAFLQLGGRPVIAWQAELVRELGCLRIIVLCDGPTPELLAIQQEAETQGVPVNLIRGPLQLVGLVSADHELLVMADGLVPEKEIALRLFGQGRGVATLPADAGLAAGFERIDAANAWGGLLASRGSIVERLAEMPPDSDTVSLLLRLALQSGSRTVAIDTAWLHSGDWMLMNGASQVAAREKALLDAHAVSTHWSAPFHALAARLARRLSPQQLKRGPAAFSLAGITFGAGAIFSATRDHAWAAILLLAACAFLIAVAGGLTQFKRGLFGIPEKRDFTIIYNALIDIIAIASLTFPATLAMLPEKIFLPLVMIGSLRLAEEGARPRWSAFWSDRISLALILSAAAWSGVLDQAMAAIILAAIAFSLFYKSKTSITAD